MITFIVRRVVYLIPTLLFISIISFLIIQLPPGDFLTTRIAELNAQGGRMSEARVESLRIRYGLDQPVYTQYWIWLSNFLQGDFGRSFQYNAPVGELIWERLGLTIFISIITIGFTWVVSIPIGIYSATHQYSLGDHFFTFIGFLGLAVPNFLLALVVLIVGLFLFDVQLIGLFSQEYVDAPWSWAKFFDMLGHVWVPVLVVGTGGTAQLIRVMRGNLLDVLGQQYVQTARAKGVRESLVIYKHATRMAINPLITIAGLQLPQIISGQTITSVVLNLPTTGPLLLRSLRVQDMYVAGALLMFLTILLVLGNLIADIVLAWTDPRIRYD